MKKLIGTILSITLALSVIGCDNKEDIKETSATVNETTTSVDETTTINSNAELEMEGKNDNEKPIDLDGTYDENDILITTLEKEQGGIVMEIPQISGLLDSDIEAKINQDMLDTVVNEAENKSNLSFVYYTVYGNFANVLSIVVCIYWEEDYNEIYFNYNLVNGEKIELEDLFMSDTDILQIIRDAFRGKLIANDDNQSYDENELYKIVKGFDNSKEKSFSFSPRRIFFEYKHLIAMVDMIDIFDKVCIYTKYNTEDSIYEKDDIGMKGIYTCVNIQFDTFDIVDFGMLEENLRYDIIAYKEDLDTTTRDIRMEEYKVFKDRIYAEIYDEMETYREEAKNNPDIFYLIVATPSVFTNAFDSNQVDVTRRFQIIEMPREKYEEVYEQKIIDTYRNRDIAYYGGLCLDITEDFVTCEEIFSEQTYDYITGEQVNE